MPLSAIDVVEPAIQHTKQQLLKPFRIGQWMRLAFVGLLAGEMGSSGGCNGFQIPTTDGKSSKQFIGGLPSMDPALLAGAIAVLFVVGLVVLVAFMYLNSRMRFVLFDSIIARECHIRQYWSRRPRPALRYFVWQIVFMIVMFGGLTILLGIPAAIAFAAGWLNQPKEHLLPLILGGVVLFFILFIYFVCAALVNVFTKDFVVPRMALEDITAVEGWRRLLPMLKAEKGGFAGYAGMKIVLAIAAAILVGIAFIVLFLIILIPVGGLGLAAVLAGKAAGLTWNPLTIALVAIGVTLLAAIFFYVSAMLSVPAIVFFPAYSIYFYASRYPALDAILHPAPPALPPLDLPPLPPEPSPA